MAVTLAADRQLTAAVARHCRDLDASRLVGIGGGGVNPYAKLFIGGQREAAHKTGVFKNNFQP